MKPTAEIRPYRFEGLPSFSRAQVALWNWYHRALPSLENWRGWARELLAEMLQSPGETEAWLVETHCLEQREPVHHSLRKAEINIGRAAENDIVLGAPAIARIHARIRRAENRFTIEDCGTKLGTFLGDRRLEPNRPEPIREGDAFTIFPHTLTLKVERRWQKETGADLSAGNPRLQTWREFTIGTPAGFLSYPVAAFPEAPGACIQGERRFLAEVAARALYPVRGNRLVAGMEQAAIEFLLLSGLERMNREFPFPWRLALGASSQLATVSESEPGISLFFTVMLSSLSGSMRVFLPLGLLDAMRASAPPPQELMLGVQWQCSARAGFVDLTSGDLQSLERGDILLFSSSPALLWPREWAKGWQAKLAAGNFSRLSLENWWEENSLMDEQQLGALPVRIQVVLGEKIFTLAELKALAKGAVIELNRDKKDPVKLVANGRLVGDGELVEVEGQIGVRILNWRQPE